MYIHFHMHYRFFFQVISYIMRFLNVSDRKEASLVSKIWYEASLDPILQKDVIVTFMTSLSHILDTPGTPFQIITSSRSLESQISVNVSFISLVSNLRSLSLKGCDITEATFVPFLSSCQKLVHLDLSCCNTLFMSGKILEKEQDRIALRTALKNVRELNMSNIRFLSDASFNRILEVCCKVEKLHICSTHLTFNYNVYQPEGFQVKASSSLLTFQNLLLTLISITPKITALNFSRTTLSNEALKLLASIKGLELQELVLVGCRDIGNKGILELCKNQPSLRVLDLSDCFEVGDGAIAAIVKHLKRLQVLKLSKARLISNDAIKDLRHLPSLTELDISECYEVTSDALAFGVCNSKESKVQKLHLNCCSALTDSFVIAVCRSLQGLTTLDLGSCFYISDQSVHAISRSLLHLRQLRLAWCKEITDLGLLGFQCNEDEIRLLNSDHDHDGNCTRKVNNAIIFRKPTDKDKKRLVNNIEQRIKSEEKALSMKNLTRLRVLDLSSCTKLTDLGITQTIRYQELKSINLSLNHSLKDASILSIAANNPSLEEINLSQCHFISDKCIEKLAKLPRLTSLNISGCDHLTDRSIDFLHLYCKRLKHLDVSLCNGISPVAVERMEATTKNSFSVQKRLVGGC